MNLNHKNGMRYLGFESLNGQVIHAIFTRHGGVSHTPYESLNVGGTVGDDPDCVRENRRRMFEALDLHIESVYDAWQVHGTEVLVADTPRSAGSPHKQADAILTNRPGVTLFMRFADCVPILLYDAVQQAIGLVHAGWKGTVLGIVRSGVQAMRERFGSKPEDLFAGIGPSIGPDHYSVGADVVAEVNRAFSKDSSGLLVSNHQSWKFDLWAANRLWLEREGVRQIEVSGVCTACHTADWYSHRAEHGQTGRFGAIIALAK